MCHDCLMTKYSGDTSLGRYNKAPRIKVQMAENVNKALEFITSRGVKLTNIGPEGEPFPSVSCCQILLLCALHICFRILKGIPKNHHILS